MSCYACQEPIDGTLYYDRPRPTSVVFCEGCYRAREFDRERRRYERVGREPPWVLEDLPLPRAAPCVVCERPVAFGARRRRDMTWLCSLECDRSRYRVEPQAKTCEACGEAFTPARADARTCSDRCRQRLSRARRHT